MVSRKDIIIPTLQMRKPRLRKEKLACSNHTASKWLSWDSNSCLILNSKLPSPLHKLNVEVPICTKYPPPCNGSRAGYKDPRVGLRLSIFVAGKKGGLLAEHLPL